jgi:hypothetical protein
MSLGKQVRFGTPPLRSLNRQPQSRHRTPGSTEPRPPDAP